MFDGEIMCRGIRKTRLHRFEVHLIAKIEDGDTVKYYKCKHCGEVKSERDMSARVFQYCVKY